MANRHTLHFSHLKGFVEWLKSEGWEIYERKDPYIVLMARKARRKHPLIIYRKDGAKEHLTIRDMDVSVVRSFLRSRKGGAE